MMDHYSDYPQPSLKDRIKKCVISLPQEIRDSFSEIKIEEAATHVCSNAPEFSLTGYCVFGIHEDIKNTINLLQEKSKNNT